MAPSLGKMLPDTLAADPRPALEWWSTNPLLCHYCPELVEAVAEASKGATLPAQRELVKLLRESRNLIHAMQGPPEGLPTMEWDQVSWVLADIEDKPERIDVRAFAFPLAPCERPWLVAQVKRALEAQTAALLEQDEYKS